MIASGDGGTGELTRSTVSGLRWTYTATVLSAVMQLTYTVVMARLLDPAAFGLMAIAQLVLNFTTYLAKMGVGQALIQKEELNELHVRAGFTSSVVLGIAAAAVVFTLAPALAGVFGKPAVTGVLQLISLNFVLGGFGLTADALLRRQMRFRELAILETTAFFVGYLVVGIGFGVAGAGVWSLVAATLAAHVVGQTSRYVLVRHSLRPTFRPRVYRPLFAYGGSISVMNLLDYFGNNLDTIFVGRYASANLVGQYNKGFYLVNLPMTQATLSLNKVLFPGLSRIQDDAARLARVYHASVGLASLFLLPLVAGIAVAADELVYVILGPQWNEAAALLPLFCVAAGARVLSRFASVVCEARAQLGRIIAAYVSSLTLFVVVILVAADGPLWRYAAALAVSELVRHMLYLGVVRRVIGTPVRFIIGSYLAGLMAAVAVGAAIATTSWVLPTLGAGHAATFAADVVAGAAALAAMMRWGPIGWAREELVRRLRLAGALDHPAVARVTAVLTGRRALQRVGEERP